MSSPVLESSSAVRSLGSHVVPALHRSRRLHEILEGPIAAMLVRLAAPTLLVVMTLTALPLVEAHSVARLGTDALAGLSLVFPGVMLMAKMSSGGLGGAVVSAVARALGAGRRDDAEAIAVHGLVLAIVLGIAFTTAAYWGGPALYRAMGGRGPALAHAVRYSNTIFAGAMAFWAFEALAGVLRGSGNMLLPAVVGVASAVVLLPVMPALITGRGFLPALGVAGGAVTMIAYYLVGATVLLVHLLSGRSVVRLRLGGIKLRREVFVEILGVGSASALMAILGNVLVIVATGFVGSFGVAALAGYGLATRLEFLLTGVLFALGTASVTMVGTQCGAGRVARAERVAWTALALGGSLAQIVGVLLAVMPALWIGYFTRDPGVLSAGGSYFRIVAPLYGFMGSGFLMFFASQGAARMRWPLVGNLLRLGTVIAGGWLAVRVLNAGMISLFLVLAASTIVFGTVNAVAVWAGDWRRGRPGESLEH